ncbi:MAG: hypothetical protein ACI9SQ_001603 [Rubritalea sp.]|jgi:hypothetical protein
MFKKITSNTLIVSALFSSSLFMCSCDSSDSMSSNLNLFDDDPNTEVFDKAVDQDFQTTLDRFVIEANDRNINVNLNGLSIQYGDTDGALGVCSFIGNLRQILISPDLRDSTDDLKSEIVLHELGHCILNREHSSDPNSIMHATNIIGQPWRTEVLDELFSFQGF